MNVINVNIYRSIYVEYAFLMKNILTRMLISTLEMPLHGNMEEFFYRTDRYMSDTLIMFK